MEMETKSKDSTKNGNIYINDYPPVQIVWRNVCIFVLLHIGSTCGLYSIVTGQVMWQTVTLGVACHYLGILGTAAGAHRLWCHRAYKASLPLKIFFATFQTMAFQNSIFEWCRDHRLHHKYSDTVADPHNAKRGFFFSHMGWLLCRKHPAIRIKGKEIKLADLEADPVVKFQRKYYLPLAFLLAFVVPSVVPWYFWGETSYNSAIVSLLKYTTTLHVTWLVNSAAHMWGTKPYDKLLGPCQNKIVSILGLGEGWHNYHHAFPWDYKTSEFGPGKFDVTTAFLDLMAKLGQAYDLKTVPENVIRKTVEKRGDGSHPFSLGVKDESDNTVGECGPYAWGDTDIPESSIAATQIMYPAAKP